MFLTVKKKNRCQHPINPGRTRAVWIKIKSESDHEFLALPLCLNGTPIYRISECYAIWREHHSHITVYAYSSESRVLLEKKKTMLSIYFTKSYVLNKSGVWNYVTYTLNCKLYKFW